MNRRHASCRVSSAVFQTREPKAINRYEGQVNFQSPLVQVAATRGVALWATLVTLAVGSACLRPQHAPPVRSEKHIAFSILEDYDKGEDLDDIGKDFDLFKALGVTTWRGSFGWDDFEPSAGVYDFAWLHRFADLAAARGIVLRPYIGYTPSWAAAGGADREVWNDPPNNLDAWFAFVRTLAAEMRRHRNIVSYEIYNEENVRQWWDGSPDTYRAVLRRAAEAVTLGNPDAEVLPGGMVYPDAEWTERLCSDDRIRRSIAAVPFHAYPETWTPADVRVENYLGSGFTEFVHQTDASCGPKPIWINEMGYATMPGRSEADQARWWIRAIATFAATPRIAHLGIYEIKDLRPDRSAIGDAPNYHLGLTYADRRRKLAFGTVARMVSLLGEQPLSWRTPGVTQAGSAHEDVHRYLFTRRDGRQLLVLWTRQQRATVDVELSGGNARAIEFALDGTPAGQLTITGGTLADVVLEPDGVRFFEIVR